MVALGTIYRLGAVMQGALGDRFGLRAVTARRAAAFLVVLMAIGLTLPGLADAFDDLAPVPAMGGAVQ